MKSAQKNDCTYYTTIHLTVINNNSDVKAIYNQTTHVISVLKANICRPPAAERLDYARYDNVGEVADKERDMHFKYHGSSSRTTALSWRKGLRAPVPWRAMLAGV
jgi:spore coat protein U-like protein